MLNKFPYDLDFKSINFREQPHLYRSGVGEQGVLLVEPYKSEILPYWKFKDSKLAKTSSEKIYELFLAYLEAEDFVGADMARKFLQMGFTRARRYANHPSGKKYQDSEDMQKAKRELAEKPYPYSSGSKNKGNSVLRQADDALTNEKARAAEIFKQKWFAAKDNPEYQKLKRAFKEKHYK
jgi:hypothetical protein